MASDGVPESVGDETAARPVVLVSNRGPVTFSLADDGTLQAKRGAGGLVSGLAPLIGGTDTMWVAAAMSAGDRHAATRGVIEAGGFHVRTLAVDPDVYRMAYDVVCNQTLWFVHHHLFDLSHRPRFDTKWREAWHAYREMNLEFAQVVVAEAPPDATVLVQDYHLTLLGPLIRANRPDLRTVHFSHTPFAALDYLRVLPDDVVAVLLEAMTAYDACGFHTRRWARAFEDACEDVIGDTTRTFVAPLAADGKGLQESARSATVDAEIRELRALVGDRRFVVRVDRIELSKNLLRGFHAYEDLLRRYPEWRGRVVFGAFVYPSREGLAEYLAYRNEVESLVRRINDTWGTPEWTPIIFDDADNYARSVAALCTYDVLFVNVIRDGLNLVAKEGPLVNTTDGVVLLSREAGAWDELAPAAIAVHPYDEATTADTLHTALSMNPMERAGRAAELRALAGARGPQDWLEDQRRAAGSA